MKKLKYKLLTALILGVVFSTLGQEEEKKKKKDRPVRPMFESAYLLDNQSVTVYKKNTLEWAIQHKFGTIDNGLDDYFGLWGIGNVRNGFTYVPIDNVAIGYGITQGKMYQDFNVKWAFLQQTRSGSIPVSLTYYVNMAIDSRNRNEIVYYSKFGDRVSYYHQLIIARKITSKIFVQVSPSMSHFNAAPALRDENGDANALRKNDHWALSLSGRYKITSQGSVLLDYNLPLTSHPTNDPKAGFSFGWEISTSSHAFQLFMGQYKGLVPQENNYYNQNTELMFGFVITKLWSL